MEDYYPTTITVVGSLNKDLITRTSRIPSAGETLIASSFETGSGGKGANQAVACARLADRQGRRRHHHQQQQQHQQEQQRQPHQQEQQRKQHQHDEDVPDETRQAFRIRMVGAVGNDGFGQDLINGLTSNGVDVSSVRIRKAQQTGVAVVLVDDESGENRILVSPNNANYSLTSDDFETLLTPPPDLIILQLEINLEIVCRLIKLAKASKVPVLLNPAPAPAGGLPREVYAGLTHLILNESEARILRQGLEGEGDEEAKEEGEEEAAADHDGPEPEPEDPAKIARRFLNLGVENVVITLGSQGAYYASSTQSESESQSQSQSSSRNTLAHKTITAGLHPIPPDPSGLPLKVVDTTGAGDTFVGAYAVKICEEGGGICGGAGGAAGPGAGGAGGVAGEAGGGGNSDSTNDYASISISHAVQWANLAASRSVLKEGAQEAMPWREEIDELGGGGVLGGERTERGDKGG